MALTNTSIPKLVSLFNSSASRTTAYQSLQSMKIQRLPYPEYFQSVWALILPIMIPFLVLFVSSVWVVKSLVADMVRYTSLPTLAALHSVCQISDLVFMCVFAIAGH